MTDCKQQSFEFQEHNGRAVLADFNGGYLSSDGGALILRESEKRSGVIAALAGCFRDERDERYIEHRLSDLLSQRITNLILGYEDLNDADRLRYDPLLSLVSGREDVIGAERKRREDAGKAMAGSSTLNRLELGSLGGDGRYRKIISDPGKIEATLIEQGVKAIPRKSRQVVLDFDATDDPLHGNQEGAYFHGYYKNYCYLPLYCFCGNIPLWAELRDCKRDASAGTVEALEKIVSAIRARFGRKVRIVVRGDGGFAREKIMAWCEQNGVLYCLGLARNARLASHLETAYEKLHAGIEANSAQVPARDFVEINYRTLKSWSRTRRVVGKAEVLAKGDNPRFVVTNIAEDKMDAAYLYERFYCARGEMENRIKEQQLGLFADRTSTHAMASNQLRLWFSAFAHLVTAHLQSEVLKNTELAHASITTIRLKLFKIAAKVKVSCRRIHIELPSACPYQALFAQAHANLRALDTS
jgi:hypothetical protein